MTSSTATRCGGVALVAVLVLPSAPARTLARGQEVPPPPYALAWQQPIAPGPVLDLTAGPTTILSSAPGAGITAHALGDGRALWTTPAGSVPLTLAGDLVIGSIGDRVVALDEATGRERWSASAGGAVVFTALDGERALAATHATLVALRVTDGQEIWRTPLSSPAVTPISIAGGLAVVGLDTPALVGIDTATGVQRWHTPLDTAPIAPTAAHGRIYVGLRSHHACAFRQSNGTLDWCFAVRAPIVGAPAVDDRFAYFAVLDNTVRALDRGHGAMKFRLAVNGRPISGPRLLATTLALPLISGELALVQPPSSAAPAAGGVLPPAQPDESLQAAAAAADGGVVVRLTIAVAGTRRMALYRRTAGTAPGTP